MISLLWLPFAGKTTADWQSNEIWNRISHKYGLPNSERVRGEKTRRMPAKNSRQNRRQCRKNRKSAIATTTTTTTLPLVQVQCNNNSQEHVTHKWKCKGLPQQHNLANSSVNLASQQALSLSVDCRRFGRRLSCWPAFAKRAVRMSRHLKRIGREMPKSSGNSDPELRVIFE